MSGFPPPGMATCPRPGAREIDDSDTPLAVRVIAVPGNPPGWTRGVRGYAPNSYDKRERAERGIRERLLVEERVKE
jgi:hypothetical protein